MNSPFGFKLLLLTLMLQECEHKVAQGVIQPLHLQTVQADTDSASRKLNIREEESFVKWKGTKLNQTGKHEGTVAIRNGELAIRNEKLVGGSVVIDMKSIKNTDMPLHEQEARQLITEHLNKDFNTATYPTAKFEITRVTYLTKASLRIQGNLIIRGISKNIAVPAKHSVQKKGQHQIRTDFLINRFDWGIGESGSWLEKRVVDKEIHLDIKLVTE